MKGLRRKLILYATSVDGILSAKGIVQYTYDILNAGESYLRRMKDNKFKLLSFPAKIQGFSAYSLGQTSAQETPFALCFHSKVYFDGSFPPRLQAVNALYVPAGTAEYFYTMANRATTYMFSRNVNIFEI